MGTTATASSHREKVRLLTARVRPRNENPELVNRDDEIPF